MSSGRRVRSGPYVVLTILVCLAGAAVGWFFGVLASLLYLLGPPTPESSGMISLVGQSVGAGSGLLAGAIWCWVMIRRATRRGTENLVMVGGWVGVGVGVLSTALLHVGLTVETAHALSGVAGGMRLGDYLASGFANIGIGLLFGIPAGAVTGLICGGLCRRAAREACPSELDELAEERM